MEGQVIFNLGIILFIAAILFFINIYAFLGLVIVFFGFLILRGRPPKQKKPAMLYQGRA